MAIKTCHTEITARCEGARVFLVLDFSVWRCRGGAGQEATDQFVGYDDDDDDDASIMCVFPVGQKAVDNQLNH